MTATITTIQANLLSAPKHQVVAHCISSDCALGAGVAKVLANAYPEGMPEAHPPWFQRCHLLPITTRENYRQPCHQGPLLPQADLSGFRTRHASLC